MRQVAVVVAVHVALVVINALPAFVLVVLAPAAATATARPNPWNTYHDIPSGSPDPYYVDPVQTQTPVQDWYSRPHGFPSPSPPPPQSPELHIQKQKQPPTAAVLLLPPTPANHLRRLCPEFTSANGGPLERGEVRYDPSAKKCGVTGSPEHCPQNMIFYADANSQINGYCDCATNEKVEKPLVLNIDASGSHSCHRIFEQGYCPPGQWITPATKVTVDGQVSGEPICTQRPCGGANESDTDWALFKGECVRPGRPHDACGKYELIGFHTDGTLEATCVPNFSPAAHGVVRSRKCTPGTFLSLTGKCQQGFSWNL